MWAKHTLASRYPSGPMASTGVPKGPNVVLVVLDTLTARAAALSDDPPPMPGLAHLAQRGATFSHAVSNAPWTYPSHASLLTGLLPSEHGMDTPHQFTGWELDDPTGRSLQALLPPGPAANPVVGPRWLPALLAAAGYETACVSNNPWVGRLTGMELGFHRLRDPLAVRLAGWRSAFRARPRLRSALRAGYNTYRAMIGGGDLLAADAVRLVRSWTDRRDRSRPFFLLVNLIEAHAPYLTPLTPRALRELRARPGPVLRAMRLLEPRWTIRYNLGDPAYRLTGGALRVGRALHETSARYLDTIVTELHEIAAGQGRDVLTCVTSDHGESFGEHGSLLHGFTLDEETLHVPLVVSGGGVPAGDHHDTVDLRRVYATLLEAVGLAVPEGAAPSLLDSERGVAVAERERLDLPAWADIDRPLARARVGRIRAAYRDPWKLVATDAGTSLFDRSSDPGERVDLAGERPDVRRELEAMLPAWPDQPSPGPRPDTGELTEAEERELTDRLAALGYVE